MPHELSPCPIFPFSCVSSRSGARRISHVEPLRISGDASEEFGRLETLVREQPRTTVLLSTGEYLHVAWKVKSGYTDDVEFRLCREDGVIHVRSASRFGPLWDLNANRKRVEAVRALFEEGG